MPSSSLSRKGLKKWSLLKKEISCMNVSKSVAIFKAVKLIRNLNQLGSQWFGIVTTLQFSVLE